jgi:hypothetical protein
MFLPMYQIQKSSEVATLLCLLLLKMCPKIAYFPETYHNRNPRTLPSCYLATIRGYTDTCVQISSVVMCIRCRGNVFTKQLPSYEMRDTHRDRLMGRIYEVRCWYELRCHHIHTKLRKDWLRHWGIQKRHTDNLDIA